MEALAPPAGGVALDAACGTGRAVPFLRRAVGPSGTVVAVDVTPEMLAVAAAKGRAGDGALVQADVGRLPLADRSVDAILAAGLIGHHGDAHRLLGELARVARPGATLALFHPISRAALAARHGTVPDPGDVRADPAVRALLAGAGWEAELVDDGAERYLVVGRRR